MTHLIPEEEYKNIMAKMPIFCIDFLIRYKNKFLLLKREDEPLKGVYWVIGGRLRFKETIEQLAKRVQMREIGRYFPMFKYIGFSNYFFPKVLHSRAIHTPTLLFLVEANEIFEPKIDNTHSHFIWSKDLPKELESQTIFFDSFSKK